MFKRVDRFSRKLRKRLSEKGQGMIEYAIIMAVIAVISVAIFMGSDGSGKHVGEAVNGLYEQSSDAVSQIKVSESD